MILLVLLVIGVLLASIDDIVTSFATISMFIGMVAAISFARKKLSAMEDDNIYRRDSDNSKNMLR